jgi:hypothetical protein
LGAATTRAFAVNLRCGGHLLCFLRTGDVPALAGIAANVDALLRWMGVPRGFTVLLVWRDDPRRIAADEWPSRRTVNGGWTTQGSNTIVVYRAEEYDRVILHEIVHAMDWDWAAMPQRPLACWGLGDAAQLTPHLFEAWTELYAEWLWCVWNDVDWAEQVEWATAQAVQICARQHGRPWRENTSVFAYYVLKAALAPHIGFLCATRPATAEDRAFLLCTLAAPQLAVIRAAAASVTPRPLMLRMSKGASTP